MITDKYKILHVIDHLGTGGAQEVILNLIKYRDHSRFDCEVACIHGRGAYYDKFKELGFSVHSLSTSKYNPFYLINFLKLLRKNKYDALHFHLNAANILMKPLAALSNPPVRINHDHNNDEFRHKQIIQLHLDKWSNKFSTHIIPVCTGTQELLTSKEGLDPQIMTTIINGVDIERFQPRADSREKCRDKFNLPHDAFVIAGIGRLRYQKNFALFLDVAAKIIEIHPNTHFVIAGDGPDEQDLKNRAQALNISKQITFTGFVYDVTEIYPAIDVFLLTSRFEGTPMTILEAMACRATVVASAVDGICEVLEHGRSAMLCKPGEPDEYVNAIDKIVRNEKIRHSLADQAYNDVMQKFSAAAMTRQVEDIYMKFLKD